MRTIAIDWSGAAKHAADKIWIADVQDGRLVDLFNGLDRDGVVQWLIDNTKSQSDTYVGLDFAFSFPAWFVEEFGGAPQLWQRIKSDEVTFWERTKTGPFHGTHRPFDQSMYESKERITDRAVKSKSVFQVSGIGSVGTGSIRGMARLAALDEAGFSIWPFTHHEGAATVLEIYPKVFTGDIVKSNAPARLEYVRQHNELERYDAFVHRLASSSEDAFDAVVSAFGLWEHLEELATLPTIDDPQLLLEGIIWAPNWRDCLQSTG
jgi:hypothetical protein